MINGCEKSIDSEEDNLDDDFPPFEGIVKTDSLGFIIEDDPDDWQPRCDSAITQFLCPRPAYPNPMEWECYIHFFLFDTAFVTVTINDRPDRIIKTMLSNTINPGYYIYLWQARDNEGRGVPDGIYRVYFDAFLDMDSTFQSYGDIQIIR
jgi:hypothetical protein